MKKLIFVRHGRAEDQSDDFPDFDRSLTDKGKIISAKMASNLSEREKGAIAIVTSPAFRAYETALIFARELEINPDNVILNSELYGAAGLKTIARIIEGINSNIDTIILFGHNPAFTEIPDRLSKDGCDFMPKSGIVCLSFKTDTWNGIVHEKGRIEYFLKPEKS
jgi:phosphohistidine phosphatase